MLILNAELGPGILADVRITNAKISAIDKKLARNRNETLIDAQGASLLVGLHDHHMHLMGYAASLESISCGPPLTTSSSELARRLHTSATRQPPSATSWLRGIGYHESVAGNIDRDWLDSIIPHQPLRIQHRSGRLWLFNSRALQELGVRDEDSSDPLERIDGRLTGRLYDGDDWMRARIPGIRPSLIRASNELARFGVTGITDASMTNGAAEFQRFASEYEKGGLRQDMLVMGGHGLDDVCDTHGIRRGPTKLYLRESALPELDDFCARIVHSRRAGRAVAVHCVTLVDLVFCASALQHCGSYPGDRIEHASVAPPEVLKILADQGVIVVTQPNFVRERGDTYLTDVAAADLPWLYRARGFVDAGIPLAAGTDAPYGDANPWQAMGAAVNRLTDKGCKLGASEALTPREAIGLFTSDPRAPGARSRRIRVGANADLCLLDRDWARAYDDLSSVNVNMTIKDGQPIWRR